MSLQTRYLKKTVASLNFAPDLLCDMLCLDFFLKIKWIIVRDYYLCFYQTRNASADFLNGF